jgi:hypothetical protein
MSGATLPAGSGTLVTLSYTATAESSSLSLGNFGAVTDGNGNAYATAPKLPSERDELSAVAV